MSGKQSHLKSPTFQKMNLHIDFTIAAEHLYNENYKPLKKETLEDTGRQNYLP
jgi:hypothetical protein